MLTCVVNSSKLAVSCGWFAECCQSKTRTLANNYAAKRGCCKLRIRIYNSVETYQYRFQTCRNRIPDCVRQNLREGSQPMARVLMPVASDVQGHDLQLDRGPIALWAVLIIHYTSTAAAITRAQPRPSNCHLVRRLVPQVGLPAREASPQAHMHLEVMLVKVSVRQGCRRGRISQPAALLHRVNLRSSPNSSVEFVGAPVSPQ